MKYRSVISGTMASFLMLILILDSQTVLRGAKEGIQLCINTVIPSLFPFILISIVLTNALSGVQLHILRPLAKICGMPAGSENLLIPGFLGGYPVGAQAITSAWRDGFIRTEDAEHMLTFCSNAGPAFLFGMASALFSRPSAPWSLWGIHIISAVMTAMCFPARSTNTVMLKPRKKQSLSDSLTVALRVMSGICGWVILFRVTIVFLNRWIFWLLPVEVQVVFIGLMELSNGCCSLIQIKDEGLRFVFCSCFLACGSLCVVMQTVSVTKGLSIKPYLYGKAFQLLFSLALSTAVIYPSFLPPALIAVVSLVSFCNLQKRSSISEKIGV